MESCYHELGRPKITGVLGGPSSGGINRGPRIESLKKTALFSHFSSCQTDGVLLPPRGTSGVVRDSVLKSGTPGRFVLVVQSGRGGARPDPPASFCWRRPLEHTKYPRTLVLCTPAPPPPTGHTPLNLDQTGRLHTYIHTCCVSYVLFCGALSVTGRTHLSSSPPANHTYTLTGAFSNVEQTSCAP